MNTEEQINELNTYARLRLAPSPIHGIGVFAMRDIQKGTRLYAQVAPRGFKISKGNLSKLLPEVKQYILERWPLALNNESFAWPDCFIQGYMNHSKEYNYDLKTDTALRDIKTGEEVTENYKDIENWQDIFTWLE